jgi:nicotinate-nucleotide pyrophosphorylase (carboxylating)
MNTKQLKDVALRVFAEDEISKDLSTELLFRDKELDSHAWKSFSVLAKEEGVFSGLSWFETVAETVPFKKDSWLKQNGGCLWEEGQVFKKGDEVIRAQCRAADLLSVERSFLNMLQHLCGVATLTNSYVKKIKESAEKKKIQAPKLLHTRKTLPLLRELQIEAVLAGGAHLHRKTLHSRVMLKDNHLLFLEEKNKDFSEWIEAHTHLQERKEMIVEVENQKDAMSLSQIGVGQLLLDNFTPDELVNTVSRLPSNTIVEVSGSISLENIENYVIEGVHFISVGKITHSVKSIDLLSR